MAIYLDETVHNYLTWLKDVKKAPYHTFRAYQIDLQQFLKHFLRIDRIELPGKEDLEEYIGIIKNKYNYSTYRRKITALRNFIAYIIDSGINIPDPFISISLPMPDIDYNIPATYDEILKLNESLPENDYQAIRDKLIFALFAKCGLTIKQALKIKIKDINLAANQIILSNEQLTFIDDSTKVLIEKYYSHLNEKNPLALDDYLLTNNIRLPLSTRTLNLIIDKISQKMNFKTRLSPTVLRRLFAKSLKDRNINKTTKEMILGKKCRLAS
ncbi:MAG: tyrosine-type recombinase/integrase [Candidatus Melainabacteria bacterium]|nr:tyrosine-type recombinase/integrase [Candidatus Melainabacteria bacterium]MBI3308956.1 tyrosine-type recombinase/integrase [Candidatus Melainabacteria bacterium]